MDVEGPVDPVRRFLEERRGVGHDLPVVGDVGVPRSAPLRPAGGRSAHQRRRALLAVPDEDVALDVVVALDEVERRRVEDDEPPTRRDCRVPEPEPVGRVLAAVGAHPLRAVSPPVVEVHLVTFHPSAVTGHQVLSHGPEHQVAAV